MAYVVTRLTTAGQLDTSLNGTGYVVHQLTTADYFDDLDSDTVAITAASNGQFYVGAAYEIDPTLWRYNANGSLDTSFANGGMAWLPIGFSDLYDVAAATISQLIVQPDGKILACGVYEVGDSPETNWMVARFNPNGSVDSSFGDTTLAPGGGTVEIPSQIGNLGQAPLMALQSDGKILVGGTTQQWDAEVHRLTQDGQVDPTFTTNYFYPGVNDGFAGLPGGLLLEPDNAIVLVMNPESSSPYGSQIGLLRLQNDLNSGPPILVANPPAEPPDGGLDPSYGFEGRAFVTDPSQVWTDGPQNSVAASALQSDGKVVLVGSFGGSTGSFWVERLNADGTIDTTFGNNGEVLINFPYASQATSVVIQPNGDILIGGTTLANAPNAATDYEFAMARLTPNGTLDTTFGTGGKLTIDFTGNEQIDSMRALRQRRHRRCWLLFPLSRCRVSHRSAQLLGPTRNRVQWNR